jgi:hypothetical protein
MEKHFVFERDFSCVLNKEFLRDPLAKPDFSQFHGASGELILYERGISNQLHFVVWTSFYVADSSCFELLTCERIVDELELLMLAGVQPATQR